MAKARKSKVVKTRKNAVSKTRNSGTMTEAAFWSFIRSALRQKSRWWKPVSECKQNARRIYAGPLKRQKWEFQCNYCKKWFKISYTYHPPLQKVTQKIILYSIR